ncbi:hypothetical protein [Paludibacterium purpuratum]|uniref:Lipoprotein n=1 Tax=Paludibacterium purpuratum TaxID=1144873 RepID=A0A4R7AVF1_9NEIS|nr:hypothetical protein [Paludibacterium purpuratum]TDR71092.1 hypothetical protein DFP86_12047 [Paludibacterium purpuratum]
MPRHLLAYAGLIAALSPLTAQAAVDTPRVRTDWTIEQIAKATAAAWPALADEKLDMAFYRSAQILASDGRRAWLIDAHGHRAIDAKAVRALDLPPDGGTYAPLEWQGKPTVYLGMAGDLADAKNRCPTREPCHTWEDLFSLATHEALHFYGQNNWHEQAETSRATPFPIETTPRQYRGQLLLRLRDAIDGKPQALGQASYWLKRWQAEYPEEARNIADTDRMEGVAMYVDRLAVLLANRAPRYSAQWRRILLKQADHDLEYRVGISVDEESYTLGALASALLDRRGVSWWQRVAAGATPLDLLLQGEPPIVNDADQALNERIRQVVQRRLGWIGLAISPFVQTWQASDSRILLLPDSALRGSYQSAGFFSLSHGPRTLIHRFDATLALSGGRARIKSATVAQIGAAFDCAPGSDRFYAIALTPEELSPSRDGRLRLENERFSIDIPFPQQSGAQPRMYCAQA